MKKGLLALLFLMPALTFASYFSDGIRAYKNGDYTKAKTMFERAVNEEGSDQAYFLLGLLYLKGKGVKKDPFKAKKYLLKAVDFGNIRAKCYLAEAMLLSKSRDKKRTIELLKEGKEGGAEECGAIAMKYRIPI
ncbi:MAG: tetratricopeptide repeat protein [Hydrogenimonas sp.]|nr:tetratricopeptide repeat protein [Hydrogenimonas sp.]